MRSESDTNRTLKLVPLGLADCPQVRPRRLRGQSISNLATRFLAPPFRRGASSLPVPGQSLVHDPFHPAAHSKASEVRVARQGLSPLSGLMTCRRWVTPWAETVHFSRSKVVPGGLKRSSSVPG